jgi:uncharacterized protein (UPF0303 family)
VVRSIGPVGVVVSGLPRLDDHRVVVAALRALLAAQREPAAGGS